jgi:hypothetical protein
VAKFSAAGSALYFQTLFNSVDKFVTAAAVSLTTGDLFVTGYFRNTGMADVTCATAGADVFGFGAAERNVVGCGPYCGDKSQSSCLLYPLLKSANSAFVAKYTDVVRDVATNRLIFQNRRGSIAWVRSPLEQRVAERSGNGIASAYAQVNVNVMMFLRISIPKIDWVPNVAGRCDCSRHKRSVGSHCPFNEADGLSLWLISLPPAR